MDKPQIVCFGDSITYGQGLDDPTADSYPAVLERLLGVRVANRGYCGDTTRIALERFPRDVQESGAAVVVAQFGHNDCNRWQTDRGLHRVAAYSFLANLIEMRERAERFQMRCVFLAPHPSNKGEAYEHDRRRYVDRMREAGPTVVVQRVMLADHIHPNEDGHRAIARALLPYLEPAA